MKTLRMLKQNKTNKQKKRTLRLKQFFLRSILPLDEIYFIQSHTVPFKHETRNDYKNRCTSTICHFHIGNIQFKSKKHLI